MIPDNLEAFVQFPDVTRAGIKQRQIRHRRVDALDMALILLSIAINNVAQTREVGTVPHRWSLDLDYVEPKIKVLLDAASFDFGFDITVGGGDDPISRIAAITEQSLSTIWVGDHRERYKNKYRQILTPLARRLIKAPVTLVASTASVVQSMPGDYQ